MPTQAEDAVNTTKSSTGPKSEAGNAIFYSSVLYAARDFIRPGEEEEYARTLNTLIDELTPEGALEQTFALEIVGATWRLRRCRLVEESFASSIDNLDFDAMLDERTEKQQKTVDRARAQSHLILRRSIAELRKLQTDRTVHQHLNEDEIPALTDMKQVAIVLKTRNRANNKKPGPKPKTGAGRRWDVVWVPGFDHSTAVKCPCGSTAYFEYCCGKAA